MLCSENFSLLVYAEAYIAVHTLHERNIRVDYPAPLTQPARKIHTGRTAAERSQQEYNNSRHTVHIVHTAFASAVIICFTAVILWLCTSAICCIAQLSITVLIPSLR